MDQIIFQKETNDYGTFDLRNVVLLSVNGAERDYEDLNTLQMKQSRNHVVLVRFHENEGAHSLELSDAECDALIAARAAFKADVEEHKKQEEERIANEIVQARELIEKIRNEDRQWVLTLQSAQRYTLDDGDTHLIFSMQPHQVLSSVQEFLVRKKLIEPGKSAVDDFDPFLKSDEE